MRKVKSSRKKVVENGNKSKEKKIQKKERRRHNARLLFVIPSLVFPKEKSKGIKNFALKK